MLPLFLFTAVPEAHMEYDFSQLTDKELEILSADLLSEYLGTRFERFKPGKDGGVDGRFFAPAGGEVILQCKHYLGSGFAHLLQALRKTEKAKIDRLRPSRYLLTTSCKLSRDNKNKIYQLLHPHIKSEDDVLGSEDLNDLLRKYPTVEKSHNKLWMSSTALLRRFLNNGVIGRSEDFLKQVASKRKFYAETTNFKEAQRRLENSKIIILSGEPGIGKTTIAENLCLAYAAHGFDVIDVIKDLSEAESVYVSGERQIFLFDDFLGSNYLDAITGKDDAHIIKFMKRISLDDSKRFILTTRTNILNMGISRSDSLSNANIRRDEYLLKIEDLGKLEKGQILYNHLWHGGLSEAFFAEICKDERYMALIEHSNYNPRLVEFVTDALRPEVPSPEEYWAFVLEKFDSPALIWRNSFTYQSDDYIRSLVKMTVFSGGHITEGNLRTSYRNYWELMEVTHPIPTSAKFNSAVEIASKSFLLRSLNRQRNASYDLFNPSIADFIIKEYIADIKQVADIFEALCVVDSLRHLDALKAKELLGEQGFSYIIQRLNSSRSTKEKSWDYKIWLADMQPEDAIRKEQVSEIVSEFYLNPTSIFHREHFFDWFSDYDDLLPNDDFQFLVRVIEASSLSLDEAKSLSALIDSRPTISADISNILDSALASLLADATQDWANDLDYSRYVDQYRMDDGSTDLDIKRSELENAMKDFGTEFFEEFSERIVARTLREFENIVEDYNFDDAIDNWLTSDSSSWTYKGESSHSEGMSEEGMIHDLFQR